MGKINVKSIIITINYRNVQIRYYLSRPKVSDANETGRLHPDNSSFDAITLIGTDINS